MMGEVIEAILMEIRECRMIDGRSRYIIRSRKALPSVEIASKRAAVLCLVRKEISKIRVELKRCS